MRGGSNTAIYMVGLFFWLTGMGEGNSLSVCRTNVAGYWTELFSTLDDFPLNAVYIPDPTKEYPGNTSCQGESYNDATGGRDPFLPIPPNWELASMPGAPNDDVLRIAAEYNWGYDLNEK